MSLKEKMTALADAVREKAELTDTLTIDEMTEAVNGLVVNGIEVDERTLTVTPSKSQQNFSSSSLGENAYYGTVTVNAIPDEYITTADATAVSGDILYMKTAYINGQRVTGNMSDYGDVEKRFFNTQDTLSINANGYFKTIKVNLVRKTLEVTPTKSAQTLWASSEGIDVFYTRVNVAPIPAEYIITTDANAVSGDILEGKTAYVNGQKVTGTLQSVTATLSGNVVTIPQGVIAEEQTLTVPEAQVPTLSENTVTVHPGYIRETQTVTVGTAKEAETFTPGTSDQTINAGTYLTGNQTIKGDANLKAENIVEGVTLFGVEGNFKGIDTSDANASAADLRKGKSAYVNGNKISGTMPEHFGGLIKPGTSDIVIDKAHYLVNDLRIEGDELLQPGRIKMGTSIFGVVGTYTSDATATRDDIIWPATAYANGNKITGVYITVAPGDVRAGVLFGVNRNVEGTFTSDADATASDIAQGKTAYVKGQKITGTATGGGGVSPLWMYRNLLITGFPPCTTAQTPVRTHQNFYVVDGKLYYGTAGIEKSIRPDINWTYACTRYYPNNSECLAIGDGKLYYVGNDVICLTPDLTGVTQVMEGNDGRYFFLCGEDIYVTFSEANKYTKIEDVKVSKILNQRVYAYEPSVMVITTTGDIAEVCYEYDADVDGKPTGYASMKWEGNGDPFINYYYVSPEDMVSDGIGYLGGYEFAFRSSGLWYRKISASTSSLWIKAENAPDLIPTNWLGYCSAEAEEVEDYDPETGEYSRHYELSEDTIALHIDKSGALWAMRANATISGDEFDPDFQLNGVTFERIGEDNDWQCVPPIPPISPYGDIHKSGYAQKGGKLVLMYTNLVDGKLVVSWGDEIISPSGNLLGCYENCCFFAPAGVTVDMSKAGGTF